MSLSRNPRPADEDRQMLTALTRRPTDSIYSCELTHLHREPIDLEQALQQHDQYERELERLGCRIERLPELPDQPDAVFVEDTVVVLPELAVITRPGAASRRQETESMTRAMADYRRIECIEAPATLEGGDVLRMGKTLYIGLSSRTNRDGIEQLTRAVERHGYRLETLPVEGCLHLKTAAADVSEGTVLVNPAWLDPSAFSGLRVIEVPSSEAQTFSALRIGNTVLLRKGCPRTRKLLEDLGREVREIDYSELGKAEAGLTCCSVIFKA